MTNDLLKKLHATHDLSLATNALCIMAGRTGGRDGGIALVSAAVAFVIQLAIDVTGRDPAEMRALERELMEQLP